jgi:hypothetical protein
MLYLVGISQITSERDRLECDREIVLSDLLPIKVANHVYNSEILSSRMALFDDRSLVYGYGGSQDLNWEIAPLTDTRNRRRI